MIADQVSTCAVMIEAAQAAHAVTHPLPSRGPLPSTGPVILYVDNSTAGEIGVVVAPSLMDAVDALDWPAGLVRPNGFFAAGAPEDLRRQSPLLSIPASGLKRGHPRVFKSRSDLLARMPREGGGIYRIYRSCEGERSELYIGQTVRLRQRLLSHEKLKEWGWEAIEKVEVIPLQGASEDSMVLLVDLDRAESEHIARARRREEDGGPHVVNITGGRNGRKAVDGTHVFIWSESAGGPDFSIPDMPACSRPVDRLSQPEREELIDRLTRVVRDEEASLGRTDPATTSSLFNLAYWLAKQGATQDAVEVVQEAFERRLDSLGPSHPDTLNARHNLGYWLALLGRDDLALRHATETLARREEVLGTDHYDSLCTRHLVRQLSRAE